MGKLNTSQGLKAVDLFCGCGGLSVGLQAAGFHILAGLDVEPLYLNSFAHNFPTAKSLSLDIAETSPQEFMSLLGLQPGELDMLAGGPPCQGFSKNVPLKVRYLDDPRNQLMKCFLDYCEALKPRLILMENVAEMKNGFDQSYTEEVLCRLTEAGYNVTHGVLNAADFGVPQRRRRAFFLASRGDHAPALPQPTHTKPGRASELPAHINVWDAIGDLPSLEHGGGTEAGVYEGVPFSAFQRLMRNGNAAMTNHVARPLRPLQYERLVALEPGQGLKDLPPHLQTKGGYSGAYGRLTKTMVAPTITRWVFHPGSGRWGHPVDARTLTIREVARLQSFPDSFEFAGSFIQRAGQLGNAVPPLLAQRIAEVMLV